MLQFIVIFIELLNSRLISLKRPVPQVMKCLTLMSSNFTSSDFDINSFFSFFLCCHHAWWFFFLYLFIHWYTFTICANCNWITLDSATTIICRLVFEMAFAIACPLKEIKSHSWRSLNPRPPGLIHDELDHRAMVPCLI